MKSKSRCLWPGAVLGLLLIMVNWSGAEVRSVPTVVIPVLCYHRFGPVAEHNVYAVTEKEFEAQLAIIAQEQYTPMTVKEVLDARAGKRPWPAKPLLITIDDGYADFMTYGKPSLDKRGYKATLFVYTDFIGSKLGLSPAQLQSLTEAGYEIGSHTKTHGKLTKFGPNETIETHQQRLDLEMTISKEKIEAWTKEPVVALAYPYGLWDRQAGAAAQAAGYQLLFTVCKGSNAPDTDPMRWHRTMIVHGVSTTTFKRLLREKPLRLLSRRPEPGARVLGPLTTIEATLSEDMRTGQVFKTLVAKSGASVYSVKINKATGLLRIALPRPWQNGADQITLTARDGHGQMYRESWLLVVVKHESEALP